jgi:hypothetical protein
MRPLFAPQAVLMLHLSFLGGKNEQDVSKCFFITPTCNIRHSNAQMRLGAQKVVVGSPCSIYTSLLAV